MDTSDEKKRPLGGDVWNWIVIGLIDAAVTVALFAPYFWELTRAS